VGPLKEICARGKKLILAQRSCAGAQWKCGEFSADVHQVIKASRSSPTRLMAQGSGDRLTP
jgi:hypothetical protein